MSGCQVRVYYKGILGEVVSQLMEHPGSLADVRAGAPFYVTTVEYQDVPPFSQDPEDIDYSERKEAAMVSKSIQLPAGSLNEMVRVYVPEGRDPFVSKKAIQGSVFEDIKRGNMRGMYFFNPSDNYY